MNKALDPLFDALGHPADKDELNSLKDLYPCPENVKIFVTPRSNPEIYSLVYQKTQGQDKKAQKSQALLTLQMRASAQAISDIYEMRKGTQQEDLKKCEDTLLDAFKFSSALY